MKKSLFSIASLFIMTAIFSTIAVGQDSIQQRSQMLDIKLQLLDSKLELLDTKIKLWESKPKELDIRLSELDNKINSMDFQPQEFSRKLHEVDSLFRLSQENSRMEAVQQREIVVVPEEPELPVFNPVYNSAIMMDPVRLLEGTLSISYERVLNQRFSLSLSGLATYSTTQGISNFYFSNQSFSYFNDMTKSYESYSGEVMSGGGFSIQFRNYLMAGHPGRRNAPIGVYAAPQFLYRNMTITGYYQEMEPTEEDPQHFELVNKEIRQHLNIFATGAVLGLRIPVMKVLAIDVFAGGNIRLSKYAGEDGFTRYKDWFNFDFSGVSPVAGIAIGILK